MKARCRIPVLLCCALAVAAAGARAQTVERVVRVEPLKSGAGRYVYVPFDVPRGASRVRVSYDYARERGANTIDIGLFDARGFRGWSGGRRSEFFVAAGEATPGYLAGALTAGRWRVVLGLYKVAAAGVDVRVTIAIETGGAVPVRRAPAPRHLTSYSSDGLAAKARWFAGDLHMHTVHSDGDWTVQGLAEAARKTGLDFIFVTDHNTSSHHGDVGRANDGLRQPLVMRGEEVTTYGGHANAWGLPEWGWVDFRVRPGDSAAMAEVAANAHRLGSLISVNHPFAACGGCDWSYGDAARAFDAFEVWNGEWDATDESALKMWDGLLRSGLRLTAVASSDSHRAQNPIGHPTTNVAAAGLSQGSLLDAIRRGRVYLTAEAGRPVVSFEAWARGGARGRRRALPGDEVRMKGPGTLLLFVGVLDAPEGASASLVKDGEVLRGVPFDDYPNAAPTKVEVECGRDGYYRLEVRDARGKMLALTNPVYVRVGRRR
jgi:hypothetical protein